jgi:hypothetical protein
VATITENRTLKENDSLNKSLVKAVLTTMENIAFEEPEILPGPVAIAGETVFFFLQVVAPYLLQTTIEVPKKLAEKLTRTIYHDAEKEIADALLDDTVGELLNTIIGTMMGDLTLGERIFEMGLPQKAVGRKESPPGNARRFFFRIEGSAFCIEIFGDAFVEPD